MQEVELIPLIAFATTGFIWIATAILNVRLLQRFRKIFPVQAESELSFHGMRHPRLLFFFLRKTTGELIKHDRRLRRMRKWFIILITLTLLWPIASLAVIAVILLLIT
jgi:hypothetical protein